MRKLFVRDCRSSLSSPRVSPTNHTLLSPTNQAPGKLPEQCSVSQVSARTHHLLLASNLSQINIRSQRSDLRSAASDLRCQISNIRPQICCTGSQNSDLTHYISEVRFQISDLRSVAAVIRSQISDLLYRISHPPQVVGRRQRCHGSCHLSDAVDEQPIDALLQAMCGGEEREKRGGSPGVEWSGVLWRGVAWCGVVWRGVAWHVRACARTRQRDFNTGAQAVAISQVEM